MSVQIIRREELKQQLGQVQVVNVLEPENYKLGLIQGSKKIPLSQLDQRAGELDKDREVVTYCANPQCSASKRAAEKLAAKGFKVKAYEGGIQEWKAAGLPTESVSGCASEPKKSEGGSCCG